MASYLEPPKKKPTGLGPQVFDPATGTAGHANPGVQGSPLPPVQQTTLGAPSAAPPKLGPQAYDPSTGTAGHVNPGTQGAPLPPVQQTTLGGMTTPPKLGPQVYDPATGTAGHSAPPMGDVAKLPPTMPPAAPDPNDPFAAMGGGVKLPGGEWVPKDHPLAAGAGGGAPAGSPAAPGAPAPSADPFAAMGGGVQLPGGEWVPKDHPLAAGAQPTQAQPPGLEPIAPPIGPGMPAPGAPAAPGAPGAPEEPSPYKDALLKLLEEGGKTASMDDPALAAQGAAFSNAQTRARERSRGEMAERASLDGSAGVNSGAFDQGLVGLQQAQGEAEGSFNAGLVGDAAKQNLQKLTTALAMMGADKNSEEGRALQAKIAETQAQIQRESLKQSAGQFDRQFGEQGRQFDVEAALKKLGITTQADLGGADLRLRDKLGTGGLNAEILRMLMQNDQFGKGLGADLGKFGAGLNQDALLRLLGGL